MNTKKLKITARMRDGERTMITIARFVGIENSADKLLENIQQICEEYKTIQLENYLLNVKDIIYIRVEDDE